MTPDQLIELKNDPELRGRLAKLLVRDCFRNSELEDLHAGKSPRSKAGDYSDVKVVTPYGEIPWNDLSRFDDEMKELMIDVVNRTNRFLRELLATADGAYAIDGLKYDDPLAKWNDPA